jgi:thiosulfate/3-mercaptopyruvate sulfurtransferase
MAQGLKPRAEMLVTTAWLSKHLNDPQVVILHVATERKHYDDGHIPGARFVALKELATTRGGLANELASAAELQKVFTALGIGDTARVVLYGENCNLYAARAYYTLDYLGHGERAALLDGGLEKWKADKQPVSTQANTHASAPFTPRLRARVKVEAPAVRDASWVAVNTPAPNVALLDARPPKQYDGEDAGGLARGGHIPGAASLYWMQHLVSNDNPVMKPVSELLKLYAAAGVKPAQSIVSYCRTGVQASHTYFTAKYLGYDVAMYDGSMSEWVALEGTEVVKGKERK